MKRALILYTSAGCHLCEQAVELLHEILLDDDRWQLQMVEIAESETLVAEYGIRIPVLRRGDNNSELGWPFDASDLARWLSDC